MTKLANLDFSVLQQCMHCGLCLPHCPTYIETLHEKHSPRGRISLMRQIAIGNLEINQNFADEMSYCLGCVSCQAHCPAGVDYTTLFEVARSDIEESGVRKGWIRKFLRSFLLRFVFEDLQRLRFLGRVMRFLQWSRLDQVPSWLGKFGLLPSHLVALSRKAPRIQKHFTQELVAPRETPDETRYRVLMLTGCVQDISYSHVNRDTVDVLLYHDCEVLTPPGQNCCGSLHAHNGDLVMAQKLARQTLKDLRDSGIELQKIDAIISNAAGCGSHLKHYDALLKEDPEFAQLAQLWTQKTKDIHEWLAEIGIRDLPKSSTSAAGTPSPREKLCYHQACHLCHAQEIRQEPVDLLKKIPDYEMVPLSESDLCCGSAGIYSLLQPETAQNLKTRKLNNIQKSGAQTIAVANPGCHAHLSNNEGQSLHFAHPISLYAQSLRKVPGGSK